MPVLSAGYINESKKSRQGVCFLFNIFQVDLIEFTPKLEGFSGGKIISIFLIHLQK
jgi:hypothetical protein